MKPIAISSILITISLTLSSCKNNKEKINALIPPKERPSYKSSNVTLLYSDSTKLKAILKAQQMITYDKKNEESFIFFPNSVQIIFYNNEQIPTSTLTANQAVYFTNSQKAYLRYNVNFINDITIRCYLCRYVVFI